jgi:DNA-binding NtrC family response regulator
MEDLSLLVAHFLARANPRRELADIPPQVWEMFKAHRWPGNVRELSNAVQRFLVTPDRVLSPELSAPAPANAPWVVEPSNLQPLRVARREAIEGFEVAYVQALLARTGGNLTRAGAIAEVSRQMVQKLMRKYGLK